ncbi:MAG: hypothetical protein ACW97Z_14260 [Candidatus Hodarchaeales archaeon]|jgi:hypothetical protein
MEVKNIQIALVIAHLSSAKIIKSVIKSLIFKKSQFKDVSNVLNNGSKEKVESLE